MTIFKRNEKFIIAYREIFYPGVTLFEIADNIAMLIVFDEIKSKLILKQTSTNPEAKNKKKFGSVKTKYPERRETNRTL